MNSSPSCRLERAINSLEGLSIGDAFGQQFFVSFEMISRLLKKNGEWGGPPYNFEDEFVARELVTPHRLEFADATWVWTDDTAMAVEVVAELRTEGRIYPDSLARRFARRYSHEPARGYGMAMYSLLPRLANEDWLMASASLFEGKGSYGNGSAMRVAPLGAYFADDLELLLEQARLSAIVTHSHEEGIAGAIAVAVAAALCARMKEERKEMDVASFLSEIVALTPNSEVRNRLLLCRDLPDGGSSKEVAALVGSGDEVACQDTVAFCCWCAAMEPHRFDEAMWLTVAGLGDRDTTCAIVGGIVGAGMRIHDIPAEWRARREPLPEY